MPRGLVFFPPGTPVEAKRRRRGFAAIVVFATVALVWPVASWVAQPLPLVLGLPASLAWIVLWLVIVFLALVWLYRGDRALPEVEYPPGETADPAASAESPALADPSGPLDAAATPAPAGGGREGGR